MSRETTDNNQAVIVLARSGISAAPLQEMARLVAPLQSSSKFSHAAFAFTEQGSPSFRDVFRQLMDHGARDFLILPMMVPFEPNFSNWIARMVQNWQREIGGTPPNIRVGRGLSEASDLGLLLEPMLASALAATPVPLNGKGTSEGSIVSDRKYRILGSKLNQPLELTRGS